jgi:C-terminal processing protease CtpA/Prc
VPAVATPPADDLYQEMLFPDPGYRMLAAFRIWAGIEFFFAYPHLMDQDWSDVLREFVPRFQAASDAEAYALTVSEMVTRIQDSHGFVSGPAHREYFGSAYAPFNVRMVEGVPLVTALTDEAAAGEAGVEVGDEILAVDGERASDRIQRLARYYAASTEDALLRNVTRSLVAGAEGADAVVSVRKADGSEVELTVPLRASFVGSGNYRTTEVVRMLEGGVGYVDLDRLTQPNIPEMMEKLADATAIVFDMRGYPDDNVFLLAAWLGLDGDTPVADFRMPILTAADGEWGRTSRSFKQVLPLPAYPTTFDGPTVMLVDERTQSSAEHTGLLFESANGTRFVGSNSAGANGNVTTLGVPGGITVTFTGLDTRHGDGRQLQRIGLEPHLYVKPTIEGIRAGRDEVLEAGVAYVLGLVEEWDRGG